MKPSDSNQDQLRMILEKAFEAGHSNNMNVYKMVDLLKKNLI
ncbi:hypothetical protein [Bacillus coahuilensis]|nr:hypothetical protein [Bacillus coahuilensis]